MIGKVRGMEGCSKGLFVRLYCIWIGVYLRVSRQSTYPGKQANQHPSHLHPDDSFAFPSQPSHPDTAKMDRHLHVPQQSRQTIHPQPDDSSPSISMHSARCRSRRKKKTLKTETRASPARSLRSLQVSPSDYRMRGPEFNIGTWVPICRYVCMYEVCMEVSFSLGLQLHGMASGHGKLRGVHTRDGCTACDVSIPARVGEM